MKPRLKDTCVAVLIVFLALVASVWALGNHRPTAAVTALASLILCSAAIRRRRWVTPLALIAWLMIAVSPVELSGHSAPDGPRIMPLVMGLIYENGEMVPLGVDIKHEVVLGGDIVGGHEPKWVIVW